MWIPPGEDAAATRAALGSRTETAVETDALAGKTVDMGRGRRGGAETPQVPPQIVTNEKDEVSLLAQRAASLLFAPWRRLLNDRRAEHDTQSCPRVALLGQFADT